MIKFANEKEATKVLMEAIKSGDEAQIQEAWQSFHDSVAEQVMADFEDVKAIYDDIMDNSFGSDVGPSWVKGVYPSDEYLREKIELNHLCVVEYENRIVASLVFDNLVSKGYEKVSWKIDASEDEVCIIHAFATSTTCQGRGVSKFMLNEAIKHALKTDLKVIRLNVISHNVPAKKFFEKEGFDYIDTVDLEYGELGTLEFCMYEYEL
jgi:ribosomal protein S18 acetylase RimI-like enzyme